MLAGAYPLELTLTDQQRLAFEACFKAHKDRVFRLGLRYGRGSEQWAEDLTQDVFIKLLEELPSLSQHDDLGGWIYRVTTNAALTRLRREKSLVGRLHRIFGGGSEEHADQADTRLELSERSKEAQAMLESLPAKERVVLSMKVLDGMAQREIATALGMSEGYVSKLLTRAWDKVRAAGWEVGDEQG